MSFLSARHHHFSRGGVRTFDHIQNDQSRELLDLSGYRSMNRHGSAKAEEERRTKKRNGA
jgi:hypothetical protein